ncbi:methylated-DNA--[protein]-cysteine S-methyltransferase [Dermabacter sp. HSID17554]|uniref:methylated-DNA--[protein]-cysteine S-methyltransferase n=1 Tax=Dermabacter sp. HSID17554 TaxID=2419511 RepID=UPI000F85C6D1|nr:methylated-DNA--[protein]-cysteine S-methyltransferase [Dermabacter sp. HSID17554]RUP86016.1 methylated-DNA--[protein]-cysteine S-methyltransferase [Dermabacter sp. HSID17554]
MPTHCADPLSLEFAETPSPLGTLLFAATSHGLVRIAFESDDLDAMKALTEAQLRKSQPLAAQEKPLDPRDVLSDAKNEVLGFLEGDRRTFTLPLDRSLSQGFRRSVHEAIELIGFGERQSYAWVAERAGNAKAVRAVGTACGMNPLPIVVPCHRVVKSDGSLGGYSGGIEKKRFLLALEEIEA